MRKLSKILALVLVLMMAFAVVSAFSFTSSAATPEKLYLTPSANWKQSNARFAAYFFGNGEKWVSMTYNSSLGVYEVEVPAGYPNVIFCRMNPSASANNWNNKWNQTADLVIPTSGANHYTVKEGTWDKGGGTWSTLGSSCKHANLSSAATCTEAQICLDCKDPIVSALGHTYNSAHLCTRCNGQATFTVAGSGAHLGTEWDTGNVANDMTFADGVYTKVYTNVAAGSYLLKVARDHDWGTAYPGSDKAYTVATAGSTVTVTLKGTTVTVTVEAPHVHSWSDATCTEAQKCSCGETQGEALGHNMVAGEVVAPTYESQGYTVYTCANGCGTTENRDYVDALVSAITGSGTEEDPYVISTLEGLIEFRDSVNAGETKYNAEGVYVALGADIDMSSVDWSVNIGDDCNATFDGIFDGKNHTISNLNATETAQKGDGYVCGGLFGAIYGNAVIKNLTIENVSIDAGEFTGNNVAAVVGFVYSGKGSIENVTVCGKIEINAPGVYGVGAIVGYSYYGSNLTVKDCKVVGDEGSYINASSGVGAISGYTNSIHAVDVEVSGLTITANGLVGGIFGVTTDSADVNGAKVSNVTLVATKDLWVNSTGIAVGTIDNKTITITGVVYENVTGADTIVGSEYAEKPTTVVPAIVARLGNTYYTSLEEALSVAVAGDTVYVLAGTYAMPAMKAGITIEGVGSVLFEGTLTGTLENLTLKNIHIKGGNAQRWAYGKGELVFENVTFEATSVYALHFDGIVEGTTILYKDCTIIGWAAMSGSPESVTFDGCTIKGNGSYGLIRTYFDATIKNCTFDVANVNTEDVYQDGIHAVNDAVVTVENCTNLNGEMKDIIETSGNSYVVLDGESIHTHKYTAGTAVDPTCTEAGYTPYTCPCGHTYNGDEVAALGHTNDEGVVTKAPTCVEVGENTLTCTVCGTTTTEEVAVTGHTAGAEATCTAAQTCTVCGVELAPMLEHVDANLDITCDYEGCTKRILPPADSKVSLFTANHMIIISLTNNYYVEGVVTEVIDAKNGNFIITDEAGDQLYIRMPVDANGVSHSGWQAKVVVGDVVSIYGKPKTTAGWNTSLKAGIQGGVLTFIDQHDHVFSEPTCTEPGYCVCGQDGPAALGHIDADTNNLCDRCSWNMKLLADDILIGTDAKYNGVVTNGEDGKALYWTWSGNAFDVVIHKGTSTYTVYTTAKDYMQLKKLNTLTVVNNGATLKIIVIKVTNATQLGYLKDAIGSQYAYTVDETFLTATIELNTNEDFVLENKGSNTVYVSDVKVYYELHEHNYEAVVTAPTCTTAGYTTYTCACGDTKTGDEVAALGHTYENCACATCGAVLPTLGQTDSFDFSTQAKFDEAVASGKLGFVGTFRDNGDSFQFNTNSTIQFVVPANTTVTLTGHSAQYGVFNVYLNGEKTAMAGTLTFTVTEETKVVIATGDNGASYSYIKGIVLEAYVDRTITSDTTINFGSEGNYKDSLVDFSGIQIGDNGGNNSQVKNGSFDLLLKAGSKVVIHGYPGYTSYKLNDGEEITSEYYTYLALEDTVLTVTPVNGNNYFYSIEVTLHTGVALVEAVDSTCKAAGHEAYYSCECHGELTEKVARELAAHTEEVLAAVAPTCTATGLTEGKKCSACGEVLVAQEEVAALGHTEEVLAAVAPTCTATGLTEGKKCSVCGEVLVAQEEVAALGHTFVEGKCECGETDPDYVAPVDPQPQPELSFFEKILAWIVELFKKLLGMFIKN